MLTVHKSSSHWSVQEVWLSKRYADACLLACKRQLISFYMLHACRSSYPRGVAGPFCLDEPPIVCNRILFYFSTPSFAVPSCLQGGSQQVHLLGQGPQRQLMSQNLSEAEWSAAPQTPFPAAPPLRLTAAQSMLLRGSGGSVHLCHLFMLTNHISRCMLDKHIEH